MEKKKKEEIIEFDAETPKTNKNETFSPVDDFDDEYEEIALEDRIVNIEKKANNIMALVIVLLALVVVNLVVTITRTTSKDTNESTNEPTSSYSYDTSSFEKIKATDIAAVSKGKDVVIWIGRQGCSFCSMYAPVLESAQKEYGFTSYYLDLTEIIDLNTGKITDQEAYEALMSTGIANNCQSRAQDRNGNEIKCEDFMTSNFGATPLTLFVKDGKMTGNIGGYVQDLDTILKEQGFSK